MTLIQGIVNAFAMFLARVIAFVVAQALSRNSDREEGAFSTGIYFVVQIVLEIVFMILGSLVIAWFSRLREFRADIGGAKYAGRDKMIGALQALQRTYEAIDPTAQPSVQTLNSLSVFDHPLSCLLPRGP